MKTKILFFSVLKDHFKTSEKEIELSQPRKAHEIFRELFESPETPDAWGSVIRFALNGEYVSSNTLVAPGSELALIPPVSGG